VPLIQPIKPGYDDQSLRHRREGDINNVGLDAVAAITLTQKVFYFRDLEKEKRRPNPLPLVADRRLGERDGTCDPQDCAFMPQLMGT